MNVKLFLLFFQCAFFLLRVFKHITSCVEWEPVGPSRAHFHNYTQGILAALRAIEKPLHCDQWLVYLVRYACD